MKWTAIEIRKAFTDYFKNNGHTVVPSSPLLPYGDPTLLFANAGMNQFKQYFTGEKKAPFKRATTYQKCMRAGGKHNDLDNVGYTKRHHTFFEMLGNFSFGDYFKEQAIKYSWEVITKVFALPVDRLYVTVYKEDEDAFNIWKDIIGVNENRIFKLGKKENFWEMGDIGPCGPCSEIHYDLGSEIDPKQKDPSMEGERFLELWNLVFMQFYRDKQGKLHNLPGKNIDTGMGLERLLRVLTGADSNFHTGLFMPIIEEIERITGVKYSKDVHGTPHRVLADHVRALTFAITDGIYPSNYGRGYVLRRILRRAHRFAHEIGYEKEPILFRLVPVVVDLMKESYPELEGRKQEVELIIKGEEKRFIDNIARNLPLLREEIENSRQTGMLRGDKVFLFYDTYGVPVDLIEEYASSYNVKLDYTGFKQAMGEQRSRAKKSIKRAPKIENWKVLQEGKTKFVGYDTEESIGLLLKYTKVHNLYYLVFDNTPFYGESGGQVGDRGKIEFQIQGNSFILDVVDTQKQGDMIIHIAKGELPQIEKPIEAQLYVNRALRRGSAMAHTATHLLHAALREILGQHARQQGSCVEPFKLRFDFNHYRALSQKEIDEVEKLVNKKIEENIVLNIDFMNYLDALKKGAMALFEGKYGETVRVIKIGEFSVELCGGTHVKSTGDIGFFKIIKEESSSSNIRRIEALVGDKAVEWVQSREKLLSDICEELGTEPALAKDKIKKTKDSIKRMEEAIDTIQLKLARIYTEKISYFTVGNMEIGWSVVNDMDTKFIRKMMDTSRASAKNPDDLVLILANKTHKNENIIVYAGKKAKEKCPANRILKAFTKRYKGGGGGSAEKAEGAVSVRLDITHNIINELLKEACDGYI